MSTSNFLTNTFNIYFNFWVLSACLTGGVIAGWFTKDLVFKRSLNQDTAFFADWVIARDVKTRSDLFRLSLELADNITWDIYRELEKFTRDYAMENFLEKKDENCNKCGMFFFLHNNPLPKNVEKKDDFYDWRNWVKSSEEVQEIANTIYTFSTRDFFGAEGNETLEKRIKVAIARLVTFKLLPLHIEKVKEEERRRQENERQRRVGQVIQGEGCEFTTNLAVEKRLDGLQPVLSFWTRLREDAVHLNNVFGLKILNVFPNTRLGKPLSGFEQEVLARIYLYNMYCERLWLLEGEFSTSIKESLLKEADDYLAEVKPNPYSRGDTSKNWKNSWRFFALFMKLARGNPHFFNLIINDNRALKELTSESLMGIQRSFNLGWEEMSDTILGKLARWDGSEDDFLEDTIIKQFVIPSWKEMSNGDRIKLRTWLKHSVALCKLALVDALKSIDTRPTDKSLEATFQEIKDKFEDPQAL